MRMIRQTLLLLVVFASPLYSDDPKWEIRHAFLGLGNRALGSIIAEDGPFSWSIDLPTNEGYSHQPDELRETHLGDQRKEGGVDIQ